MFRAAMWSAAPAAIFDEGKCHSELLPCYSSSKGLGVAVDILHSSYDGRIPIQRCLHQTAHDDVYYHWHRCDQGSGIPDEIHRNTYTVHHNGGLLVPSYVFYDRDSASSPCQGSVIPNRGVCLEYDLLSLEIYLLSELQSSPYRIDIGARQEEVVLFHSGRTARQPDAHGNVSCIYS